MKNIFFLFAFFLCSRMVGAQEPLPLTLFAGSDTSKPLILYISGDGGLNKFSRSFAQSFQAGGYGVVFLDARSYFWKKKDPAQAAAALGAVTARYLREWRRKSFVLIGYSFGADVSPFILNRMAGGVQNACRSLVLISPSAKTDFEIHVSGILGFGGGEGQSVSAEINKVSQNLLMVFGSDEKDFPLRQVHKKNSRVFTLPGGHHYDGDPGGLVRQIIPYL